MRTRTCDWYDTKMGQTLYGVQVHVDGKWMHVMDNQGPKFFVSSSERDVYRAKLRRQKPNLSPATPQTEKP